MRSLALFTLLLALAAAGAGCESRAPAPPADERPLSEALLVALAQAKNYHHLADVHLADGDPQAAIDAVAHVLSVPFPAGAPEGEDAILDARARLAKLYLGAGRPGEARRVVDEGLASTRRESFFVANLHTVSGELHEAEARRLDATDPAAARAERQAAVQAYDRSLQIDEQLQKQLFKEAQP